MKKNTEYRRQKLALSAAEWVKIQPVGWVTFPQGTCLPMLSILRNSTLLYNCRECSTNRPYFMQNKANFRKARMNANIFTIRDYVNFSVLGLRKNKAKQSQLDRPATASTNGTITLVDVARNPRL